MNLIQKQKEIIDICEQIYMHYITLEVMDWTKWWSVTEPFMEKKYGSDPDVEDFMRFRLRDVYRRLLVMKEGKQWPIKK